MDDIPILGANEPQRMLKLFLGHYDVQECAFRSARVARQGFCKLEPVTPDRLLGLLPLLPTPILRS